jgi:hypothetical protein
MTQNETAGELNRGAVETENVELKAVKARQQEQLEKLKAENLATLN